MKSLSRYLAVSVVLLSAVALVSGALARGGHRGAGGGRAVGGNLCISATLLDLSLSNIDIMVKTSGIQTAALDADGHLGLTSVHLITRRDAVLAHTTIK